MSLATKSFQDCRAQGNRILGNTLNHFNRLETLPGLRRIAGRAEARFGARRDPCRPGKFNRHWIVAEYVPGLKN